MTVLASNYQLFGNYSIDGVLTLRILDHRLRSVSTLAARGRGKTFFVAVRSTSGTVFAVNGNGLELRRTCTPAGPGCPGGRWAGAARLALPKVPVVTAADKEKVNVILTANVDHFAHLLTLGELILGSTQYPSASAGLAAFSDPNSAASRFSAYRKQQNPEGDLSYLAAFKQADSYYTAANEPPSIGTWHDDMGLVGTDLDEWVKVAVGWQIRQNTTAALQAAERTVETALAKARRDVVAVIVGR